MSEDSTDDLKRPTTTSAQFALEQYKAKLTDLGNLGSRQSATNTYYLAIVSAILGLLALKERPITTMEAPIFLAICVAGLLISILWFLNISYFRNLFKSKLTVLTRMEESLPYQTFAIESDLVKKNKINGWMRIERIVPVIFAFLFIFLIAIRLLKDGV